MVVALNSDRFLQYMAARKFKTDGYKSRFHMMNSGGLIATGRDLEKQFIGQQAQPFVSLWLCEKLPTLNALL